MPLNAPITVTAWAAPKAVDSQRPAGAVIPGALARRGLALDCGPEAATTYPSVATVAA